MIFFKVHMLSLNVNIWTYLPLAPPPYARAYHPRAMSERVKYITIYALSAYYDLLIIIIVSDQNTAWLFNRPLYFVECENHMSGLKTEQFCYCSFDLCNGTLLGCTVNACLCICAYLMIIIIFIIVN